MESQAGFQAETQANFFPIESPPWPTLVLPAPPPSAVAAMTAKTVATMAIVMAKVSPIMKATIAFLNHLSQL